MDFKKIYCVYRKLPFISAIISLIPVIVWAITDWCEWITVIGELEFGGFIIWLAIGSVFSVAVYFFTSLVISPTVVRTDAVLRIEKILNNKNSNSFSESDTEDLPEL